MLKHFLTSALIFTAGHHTAALAAKPPQKVKGPSIDIKDWMTIGSGCRGGLNRENLTGTNMTWVKDGKDRYKVTFDMGSHRLLGQKPIKKENPSFARQCALRVAVYPKTGLRIKNLTVKTGIRVDKSKAGTAQVGVRLITGKGSLALKVREYKENVKKKDFWQVDLSPDKKGAEMLAGTGCEEAKVLGADINFQTIRKDFSGKVEIAYEKSNQVEMYIDVEKCDKA